MSVLFELPRAASRTTKASNSAPMQSRERGYAQILLRLLTAGSWTKFITSCCRTTSTCWQWGSLERPTKPKLKFYEAEVVPHEDSKKQQERAKELLKENQKIPARARWGRSLSLLYPLLLCSCLPCLAAATGSESPSIEWCRRKRHGRNAGVFLLLLGEAQAPRPSEPQRGSLACTSRGNSRRYDS